MPATELQDLIEKIEMDGKSFQTLQVGETEDAFYRRLTKSIGEISEAAWNKLAEPSQAWFNAAGAAINGMTPIPPCPGFQLVIPGGPPPEPKPEKVAPPQTRAVRAGVMQRARELALTHRDKNYKELTAILASEGFVNINSDTVWNCLEEVKNVLKAATVAGFKLTTA